MKKNRVHFYTIFEYISRFWFILIIPFLQQIVFLSYNITEIISTLSMNILTLTVLIWICILEYKNSFYRAGNRYFYVKKGLFIRKTALMPYNNIHFINVKNNFVPSLFGAVKLSLDIPSKSYNNSNIDITLDANRLNLTLKKMFPKEGLNLIYKGETLKMIITAASWSNPATGLLIAVPFVSKAGKILSQELSDNFYETINIGIRFLAIGIPPIAAGIAYIMLFGWTIAFLVMLLRYANFKVLKKDDDIVIKRGLINKRHQIMSIGDINAISIKQTLLMRFLRLYTTYINAIGIGKEKGEQRMLIAASSKRELRLYLNKILDFKLIDKKRIIPPKNAFWSYIRSPAIAIMLLFSVFLFVFLFFGYYIKLIVFLTVFLFVFLLWWLMVRIIAYKDSGLSICGNSILISSYRRLSLTSSVILLDKLQYILISQNPIQRFSKLCNAKVYFFSETVDYFKVKQLPLRAVENLVESLENFKIVDKKSDSL